MKIDKVQQLLSSIGLIAFVDVAMIVQLNIMKAPLLGPQYDDDAFTAWLMLVIKSFFYGMLFPLGMVILWMVIHTFVMYHNHNRCDASYHSKSRPEDPQHHHHLSTTIHTNGTNESVITSVNTTNQFLLAVANAHHRIVTSSSSTTKLLPVLVLVGVWGMASFMTYQIEKYNWNRWWCYSLLFVIPMVSVSSYVLYHTGGGIPIFVSCRIRYLDARHRKDDALRQLCFEIKRHNACFTYFMLHPKVHFDHSRIVVDVDYKRNNDGGTHMSDGNNNGSFP